MAMLRPADVREGNVPGKQLRGTLSSLRVPGRHVAVVTTASLPWLTGTAVNPTLRAAYLAHCTQLKVRLVIPWLPPEQQGLVYPNKICFQSQSEQEAWVRDWLHQRTGFEAAIAISFYLGRYDDSFCSIMPVGDVTASIPDDEADVALLEEPEHLTWLHHGRRWTEKCRHVVGIMHTNYLDYIQRNAGRAAAAAMDIINRELCSIHCHKVIKLSDAVQQLPRSTTLFVHGVAQRFLDVGLAAKAAPANGKPRFSKGAYFIGKAVWGKGYTELLDMVAAHVSLGGQPVAVDAFGSGEDAGAIQAAAQRRGLPITFHPGRDHGDSSLQAYQVFLNPSTSDVVATTSAEALAMGKWLICAHHPCNAFFASFTNCLVYRTPEEFSEHLVHALREAPAVLSEEEAARLAWEGATQRLLDAASIAPHEWPDRRTAAADAVLWRGYKSAVTGIDAVQRALRAARTQRQAGSKLAQDGLGPALPDSNWAAHQGMCSPTLQVKATD